MAQVCFFNMEKLAMEIIDSHIPAMTDDNYYEWDEHNIFLDDSKIINNLKNGFVLLTQLICYIEASFNCILNQCVQSNTSHIINSSIENKLELICAYYHINMDVILGSDEWREFRNAKQIRNEMIHYKNKAVGIGIGIPDFSIGKKRIGEYFTKKNFIKLLELSVGSAARNAFLSSISQFLACRRGNRDHSRF